MIEPGAKESTVSAEWAESLTFDKAKIGNKDHDRLILTRGSFKDTKGDFNLAGDLVHLWLEPGGGDALAKPGANVASPGIRADANPARMMSSPTMRTAPPITMGRARVARR